MKKPLIIAIAAGVSLAVIIGGIVGIESYQQALLQEQIKQQNQDFLDSMQKLAQEQNKSQVIQEPILKTVPEQTPKIIPENTQLNNCKGSAGCYTEYVTRIVDGDTIHTANMIIRLSLTNAPETYQVGYKEATEFTKMLCPVGSKILVDQDDLQKKDQYGRILAKVFCGDKNLNSELLYNGLATISILYCATSEFSEEPWAKRYGCDSSDFKPKSVPSIPKTQASCDPSYPDFCIPSPPPDLNCKDVLPHKKFRVIGSDPHGFDGDKDGIGCE